MAKFTRADIRAIIGEGCTDDMENKLIALHLGVVDPLRDDVQKYKADAEKLPGLQRQLEEATKGGDYKEKYETLKNQVEGEKTQKAKEAAARAYLKEKGITDGASLELAMGYASKQISEVEMNGDKIKDTKGLDGLLSGALAKLVTKATTTGTNTSNPANTVGGKDYGDIYKRDDKGRYVMSTAERQKAIAEKMANESE